MNKATTGRNLVLATSITVALSMGATVAPAQAADPAPARAAKKAISAIVREAMAAQHLRSVLVRVTKGDKVVISKAFGTSMTGVPATTKMRFRNGAVAFSYVTTLLMKFVDEEKVRLNDTIDRWLPELPESDKVTLKMLANQTSGYPDYETDPAWNVAFNADPFHEFTYKERIGYAFSRPQLFPPGTNWSYAHTNFMVLGKILSKIGKKPLATLLSQKVLEPMGLTHTTASQTAEIPAPVLHSFSSERRVWLGIPPADPFYEESTFWNNAWGTPVGATQTTTIRDMATTAVAVGTGKLLSKSSYKAMTGPHLLGFGQRQDNCAPSCFQQVNGYNYGLGVVRSGSWLLQNPLLGGYAATEAYLPSKKIAIAVAVTFEPEAFDDQGVYHNAGDKIFRPIGAYIAPKDPPPTNKG